MLVNASCLRRIWSRNEEYTATIYGSACSSACWFFCRTRACLPPDPEDVKHMLARSHGSNIKLRMEISKLHWLSICERSTTQSLDVYNFLLIFPEMHYLMKSVQIRKGARGYASCCTNSHRNGQRPACWHERVRVQRVMERKRPDSWE
jgi:hypothetical protein